MTTEATAADSAGSGLEVRDVCRAFRSVHALSGVDLSLRRGDIVGLIGPNGAGKSTLVNIISGYDRPDSGVVTVDGVTVNRHRARDRCRSGVARTFQQGHLFGGLTVRENVEVAALATGVSRREAPAIATEMLTRVGADEWADCQAHSLPHGVERRVGVARALASRPAYLLLDEPAAGLNEGEIASFGDAIRQIAAQGTGVLLIDHNIRLILGICHRIKVVVDGRNFLEGTPEEVRNDAALAEAYLGRSGRQDAARTAAGGTEEPDA